jgi:hypothetical protein
MAETCEACGGKGWLISLVEPTEGPEYDAVERCDECQKYPTDLHAEVAAVQESDEAREIVARRIAEGRETFL